MSKTKGRKWPNPTGSANYIPLTTHLLKDEKIQTMIVKYKSVGLAFTVIMLTRIASSPLYQFKMDFEQKGMIMTYLDIDKVQLDDLLEYADKYVSLIRRTWIDDTFNPYYLITSDYVERAMYSYEKKKHNDRKRAKK